MNTFFTADNHFNDKEIIGFCERPFDSIIKMNKFLIKNINNRCKPEDRLIVVGDFLVNTKEKGFMSFEEIQKAINCNISFIVGNHDKNNGVKSNIYSATVVIGKKNFLICHIPPLSFDNPAKQIYNFNYMLPHVDAVICGHVHTAWKTLNIKEEKTNRIIPFINVGVDVSKFMPLKTSEIYNIYLKALKDDVKK